MRTLNTAELNEVSGGTFGLLGLLFSCFKPVACTPAPKCAPAPKCEPKHAPKCEPKHHPKKGRC